MKEGIYKLLLTSCLLFLFESAFSQEWIPLNGSTKGQAVTMDVMEDNSSVYKVKYHIKGFYDNIITNERGSFHSLSIGDGSNLSVVGAPSLPLIHRFIAIPEGTQISVSIVDDKWTTINVGQIYPAQEQTLENEKAPEFYLDEQVYHKPFIPQQLIIGKENEWRGVRCVNLSICPFKYNPMDGRMSVMNEFILKVDFTSSALSLTKKKHYEIADPFSLFDNHIFSKTNRSGASSNCPEGDLLIIVGDRMGDIANSDKMKEFRLWKAFKGFKTRLLSLSEIGNNEDRIKDSIRHYYYEGTKYVLFVGDAENIWPKMVASQEKKPRNIDSDSWYGCLEGDDDYIIDVPIGRFSTNQLNEFSNMVDKTIKYEKFSHVLNKAILMAFYVRFYSGTNYMDCCDTIQSGDYSEHISFIRAYGDSVTNDSVIQCINSFPNIVSYRGHGGTTLWGRKFSDIIFSWNSFNEKFLSSQINNMDDETCSVFYSIACNTGNIAADTICMLETFTRAPHGAVAFVGASTETYPLPNNMFNKAIFHKLLKEHIYRNGDIITSALTECINYTGGNDLRTNENALCYIIGGDPTLELWTGESQVIKGTNLNVINDSIHITFDPISNDSSYCSIVRAADGLHVKNVKIAGNSVSFPKPTFNFYVVINSHNYYPYIIYCNFDKEELVHSIIEGEEHYFASPISLQEGPDPSDAEEYGVIVQNGGKLVIHKGSEDVTIHNSFECKKGAVFEIK